MSLSPFTQTRAACAYFFAGPGLVYGMFTSRMPALVMQTGANEAQTGFILLCLGASAMISLALSGWIIDRFTSRTVLRISTPILSFALPLAGLASSPLQLGLCCMAVGLPMGFVDVSMNAQAIQIERAHSRPCISMTYASNSIGGVLGSLLGAMFAEFCATPFLNFSCVMGLYLAVYPLVFSRMQPDAPSEKRVSQESIGRLPLFILLCGSLSSVAYAAEGSVPNGEVFFFSL